MDRDEMLAQSEALLNNAALRMLLNAIASLRSDVQAVVMPPPPAPIVQVAPPDLSAIVTAVNGLKPGAGPSEIAQEIVRQINPMRGDDDANAATLNAIKDLTEKLDFRLQGLGRSFGASGPSNISDNAARQLGQVTVLNPNGPAPNQTRLLDYDSRVDGNPVYIGVAGQGSATSDPAWIIQKMTYDGSARLIEQESLSNVIWDNRASLPW